ncbi:hypothetical protein Adeg_0637 [Ammonifex degensii KC4]|uniref:Uncharacterized protein n=1 Tax=Ammonifex degensii (strain DSM 10501 / KC4) TaxID=429009 RepID=C9RC08_AMMDK|nr:hypothetical protein Adeg_0637 [Ammonifex degensii KC4]
MRSSSIIRGVSGAKSGKAKGGSATTVLFPLPSKPGEAEALLASLLEGLINSARKGGEK